MYTQCELRKVDSPGVSTMSWIPSKFAYRGRVLNLKMDDGWQNGWIVSQVYSAVSDDAAMDMRDAYRYHRKNTDI